MLPLPELVENIRQLAKKNNTSLTKLEENLGLANGCIGKWAKAKKYPPLDVLRSISELLNVTVDDLTGIKKEAALVSEDGMAEIIEIFRGLSPDNRSKLLELSRLYLDAQRKNEEKQ